MICLSNISNRLAARRLQYYKMKGFTMNTQTIERQVYENLLTAHPSARSLREIYKSTGLVKRQVKDALRRLVRKGHARKLAGRRIPVYFARL